MKNVIIIPFIAFSLLAGCKDRDPNIETVAEVSVEETYKQLLVGSWVSSTPFKVTENGVTMKLTNNNTTYYSDGTASSLGQMELTGTQFSEDATSFRLKADTTWIIIDGTLKEKVETFIMTSLSGSEAGIQIAKVMSEQIENEPSSAQKILLLNDEKLILRSDETQHVMEYRRK